ncbi:MAG: lipopolysaccharide biosynthesis protein RfbH [Omnitrophica WOR_2 bacterium RBG_13_41_10]|nr:MAG: lipopolysaccharide biosynthesis protein RfbH [Omnitrophica WOR_2 bacterium RBG_13_41_10]
MSHKINKTKKKIKKEILEKVSIFYESNKNSEQFIPGKSIIHYAGRVYDDKELSKLVEAALEFWLTAGRFAKQFEEGLARFLGIKYCMLTNSGSSANLLAVSGLTSSKLGNKTLQSGDEIITTACCFPTTLAPIIQNNLVPVFIDVDLGTYNIQAEKIERAISKKTKGLFIAHALGNPANILRIMKIVKKYNLWLIEDNCDALGAKYNEKYTGTFGHLSTSSFYPAHHITTGEGGAVLTDDVALKKILSSFRDWGRDCWCDSGRDNTCGKRFRCKMGKLPFGYDHKYIYSHIGYNLKLTDMQAAIGIEQLRKLPFFLRKRKENFNILYKGLRKYEDFLILPKQEQLAQPSWFCFPITVREKVGFRRQDLVSFLEKAKIQTRLIFAGNILRQPAFQDIRCRIVGGLKNSDIIMTNSFFIGIYPKLGHKEMAYILDKFHSFFRLR